MQGPRKVLAVAATIALVLALAASASAATRYAAPGGIGADPCADPATPCNLYVAADVGAPGTTMTAGDVIELAPGTYSEAAGDLGPNDFVQIGGVTVRRRAGAPRPVLKLETNAGGWGAFFVGSGATVSGVEIVNEGAGITAIQIQLGTAQGIVVRSAGGAAPACSIPEGTLRDSACFHTGGGAAVGASVSTFTGTHAVTLRNVTAIGSGAGSRGLEFSYFGSAAGVIGAVSAKSVLAKGDSKDVAARGMSLSGTPGTGASTTVTLDHSRYATTDTATSGGGTASVTAAGTNENITAEPLLAANGYRQLPGSPTVDKGAVDGFSGASDVDGHLRTIGAAPDIGADELRNPTETTVACIPASPLRGQTTACTVTVTDTSVAPTPPVGDVLVSPASTERNARSSRSASPCRAAPAPSPTG
jgi:hypothetical protein